MKTKSVMSILALALVAAGMSTLLVRLHDAKSPAESTAVKPVAVTRTNLVLTAGRLCMVGQTNVFTGLMIEHSADGSLRSRSAVTNGLLYGLSEGWYTNGQLQVSENFLEGVSHGLRAKWHPNGVKLSEGMIVDGMFHGTFRRWSDSGALAEQIEFVSGQPDGMAVAYFESGFLKTRAIMMAGKVIEQASWKDGENKETVAESSVKTLPAKAF